MANTRDDRASTNVSHRARSFSAGWRHRYGPWAVVTGASSGIGRALAFEIAARGLNVALVARRGDALAEVASRIEHDHNVRCRVCVADLAVASAAADLVSSTADLDVGLFVAAAGFGTSGPFLGADLDAEIEMLDVNCRALMMQSLKFGQRLASRRRGGIVLLSSLLGFQGAPHASHYAATKAYVQPLAEGLHAELAPLGVDVLAAAPGPVRTGFAARADMRMGMAIDPEVVARHTLAALGRRTTVLPGALTKVLTYAMPLPRAARAAIMGRVMAGMTKHQNDRQSDATYRAGGAVRDLERGVRE